MLPKNSLNPKQILKLMKILKIEMLIIPLDDLCCGGDGSAGLDYPLFNETSLLPWEERYRIAQGSASGLLPSIRQSLHVLNFDAPLPILPSKMPVPSYFTPPISASSLSIMSYGSADSTGGMNDSSSYVYNTNSSHITTSSSASSASAMLLHTG
ncbi:hypothetical protein SADUNF_Sadunf16G0167500 [Salix dunnii]|uniref:Uncharacterized protein n=1 Tax=Salix dunnii TaxID=1413687 RepID=A0A835JBK1_9ROSI|nr:hypothetical protein SADUNF_Sadunf16G0167500 [Salix dunnii]